MTKTGTTTIIIIILIVIGLIIGMNRGGKTEEQVSKEPIKIGFIGPLTGDLANLGVPAKTAAKIAFDEINASGGINGQQIQVIYEDGKCTPSVAANAATKLMDVDKVKAIIGGTCSGETSSFVAKAMQLKIPVISYCSSAPTLTGSGKYFFRDYPSDAYAGKFIAEYLYNKGVRKVAILYHISDYGTGLKDSFQKRFEELGGNIPVVEGAQQTLRDYKTPLAKIKSSNVEYIFTPLYTEGAIVALQQANDLGIKAKIIFADTGSDPKILKEIPASMEINYVLSKSNLSDSLKDKFMKETGSSEIPACSPQSYDAAYVLANALKKSGSDPDMIAEQIRQTDYDGVSGKIKFDTNGDLIGSDYQVWKAKAGKAEEVK